MRHMSQGELWRSAFAWKGCLGGVHEEALERVSDQEEGREQTHEALNSISFKLGESIAEC